MKHYAVVTSASWLTVGCQHWAALPLGRAASWEISQHLHSSGMKHFVLGHALQGERQERARRRYREQRSNENSSSSSSSSSSTVNSSSSSQQQQ